MRLNIKFKKFPTIFLIVFSFFYLFMNAQVNNAKDIEITISKLNWLKDIKKCDKYWEDYQSGDEGDLTFKSYTCSLENKEYTVVFSRNKKQENLSITIFETWQEEGKVAQRSLEMKSTLTTGKFNFYQSQRLEPVVKWTETSKHKKEEILVRQITKFIDDINLTRTITREEMPNAVAIMTVVLAKFIKDLPFASPYSK